jgi:hypothetical protein
MASRPAAQAGSCGETAKTSASTWRLAYRTSAAKPTRTLKTFRGQPQVSFYVQFYKF